MEIKKYEIRYFYSRQCPSCGKQYRGAPAISKKDNQTEICMICGMKEIYNRTINK